MLDFGTFLLNKIVPVPKMNLFRKKSSEKFRSVPKLEAFFIFDFKSDSLFLRSLLMFIEFRAHFYRDFTLVT